MIQYHDLLFGGPDLLPRGACLGWQPALVALHAVSASLIALGFLVIPAAIWVFLRGRRDLDPAARFTAHLFFTVILAAGVSRAVEVVTIWWPIYGLQGLLKAGVAGISIAAAIAFWPQIPKLWRLPSPRDLQRANAALAQTNASLETTIAWRTQELELAKQRFEMALSRSNITVATQDRDLRYTWIYNPRRGLMPEDVIGRTTAEVLPEEAASEATELRTRALEQGRTVSDTVTLRSPDEGVLYLDMTVSPTWDRNGAIDGVLSTAVDVTEKRLFEIRLAAMAGQLATAYRRFELALENSPITVFEQDTELRYTFMHNPPPGTTAGDFLGRTDFELLSEADQRRIVPPKQRVIEQAARESVEGEVTVGGAPRYYSITLEPKLDDSGAAEGVVGAAVDLTERRQNEKQMRLVMRELTHRSKNLLAVIQAMARKTASLSDDPEEFVAAFSARLGAIAAAHDLLVSESWSGAELGELIRTSIAPSIDPASAKVRMQGPRLRLAPDTAQNLALAFHELATNATKYGALSGDRGQIDIAWHRADGEVRILWTETGGPTVSAPDHRGFGRVLLERLVGATLGGTVELDFSPAGLRCTIAFPDERLSEV